MPTMIVCGFMVVAALILYSSGLILDFVIQKDKQEFEFRLQQIHETMTREKENQNRD